MTLWDELASNFLPFKSEVYVLLISDKEPFYKICDWDKIWDKCFKIFFC